ncbi:E3 ubiquitin-protein ligase RNF186 [Bombina bombina]|uniref:E3 ubiquitin-protein ligase RNF186 n=1 Tax=Bombina bombina TaxID=8345 RepID=UPI00235ACC21|nr:E3 ubiquitin-protein ligase RNF186 [Bombina bombina]
MEHCEKAKQGFCSRSSMGDLTDGNTSTTAIIETKCTDTHQLPDADMGTQVNKSPSIEKQDISDSFVATLTEMDCPVCFSSYDIHRVPKQLSCKHSFCVVCLKLLVQQENGVWLITCPICRAPTVVFGGLICTLQNKESLMSRLSSPDHMASLRKHDSPCRLVTNGGRNVAEENSQNIQIAAKRLIALLLTLLILLVIILQFVYTGIIKWVLGFILGVVVIVTVLICFNPNCRIKLPKTSANLQKDNYIVSAV